MGVILRTVGIRVSPNEVYYVILEEENGDKTIIAKDKITHPVSYNMPKALVHYREQFSTLFDTQKIGSCGIKITEPIAMRRADTRLLYRCNIEGVITELAASKGMGVNGFTLQTISASLGVKSAKQIIESQDFDIIEGGRALKSNYREAVLAGIAAFNL